MSRALAGVLAAPVAALVAARLAGPVAGLWAGVLVALSPIHALAIRDGAPAAVLVPGLLLAIGLLLQVEESARAAAVVALGLATGGLAICGIAGFSATALLLLAFLAARRDRRAAAGLAALVASAVVLGAALVGVARSPLDYGAIPAWIPATTPSGIVRCAGASFTRVLGLEYQLVVSHARYVLPLSALFVALMARGASRLTARPRSLLVAGALLPFALGALMALVTGRVAPLQASRLLAALPFVALLLASGLASLRGARAWVAGGVALGSLAAFLALALSA